MGIRVDNEKNRDIIGEYVDYDWVVKQLKKRICPHCHAYFNTSGNACFSTGIMVTIFLYYGYSTNIVKAFTICIVKLIVKPYSKNWANTQVFFFSFTTLYSTDSDVV